MHAITSRLLLCFLTFVVGILAVWIYIFPIQSEDKNLTINQSALNINKQEDSKPNVKNPKGDEIQVSIKILKAKKAVLTVTNKSSEDVFLTYLPGKKNGFAFFTNIEWEMKNDLTGQWENARHTDLTTGWHPLAPGETFKDLIWVAKSGYYRIKVNYLIDKQIYNEISRIQKIGDTREYLTEYGKISTEADLAQKIIILNLFKL